ncbi:MAG: GNAT family N-acetyltransferase [Leptolyngbyaceae cyanobacterium SM2_3_12]|nr:GNAT family N-acetyltransferase [Leptolyngbyaceae cyanobacterium SM2_3_12]
MAKQLVSSTVSRPAEGAQDLPALVELYDRCEVVDQLDSAPSLEDLQRRLDHPPPGGTQYRQLWETPDGQLIGVASVWVDDPREILEVWLGIRVHPDYRHQGLEAEILNWCEQFSQSQAESAQVPAQLWAGVRDDRPYYRAMYETQGYQAVRWFNEMERCLGEPMATPQFPAGFTSRLTHAAEAEAWVEMFNQSFVDHWNFTPLTLADRQYSLNYPTYQPELDWVAVAADGTLAGFCKVHIPKEENARKHRREGWISLLGTRRGYRRLGLARALLHQGLQQLQAAGLETALLGVDSENPNQAKALYESAGFRVKETYISYEKKLV